MLSVAEEILLLALDDEGDFIHPSVMIFQLSIAGAVLMDLALHERIDTDLDHLVVVDEAPTGDDVMDEVLRTICGESKVRDAAHWVNAVATDAEAIKQRLLARLVDRGILKSVDKKYMWIFGNRRYPMIDDREDREVKLRIFSVLLSDEIPTQRDVVLISLADASRLLKSIMTEREYKACGPRLEQLTRMDLIGQAMANVIRDVGSSIRASTFPIT